MWRKYFKLIKLVPGKVAVFGHGTIDFSKETLSIDLLKSLYEKKFPYLEITDLGKSKLYGIKSPEKTSKAVKTKTS